MTDKTVNILFIGSSDMEVSGGDLINHYESMIKNYIFPCKSMKLKNGACIHCKLTSYEHKIGYSIRGRHYFTMDEIIKILNDGKDVGFSDLWTSKYVIFKKLREIMLGNSKNTKILKTINIVYETVDPLFKYNEKLLPVIEKINNNLAEKFGFNSIKPGPNHVYSKTLLGAKLDKQYDCIFFMNAGVGVLYTPKNIAKVYKHLNHGGLLCNMYSNIRRASIDLVFVDFLAVCKDLVLDSDNTCIANYAKFMIKYPYLKFFDNGIYRKLEPADQPLQQQQSNQQSNKNNGAKNTVKTKKRKQRGGDALSPEQITPILTAINGDTNLQTMINTELTKGQIVLNIKKTLDPIKRKYSETASQYHLYDLIYESQVLTTYNSNPTKIWDHGTNNPTSITAGLPGTHIYVYESPASKFNLLGVVINNSP